MEVPKELTLEEELKEFDIPPWEEEGFESREEYEEWYVALVDDLIKESETYWKDEKARMMEVDKRLELIGPVRRQATSSSDINLVQQAVEEAVALLIETLPRPRASNKTVDDQEFAGQLTAAMNQEMDANEFESTVMPKTAYNMKKFFVGVQKITWDPYANGQFGNRGRIVVTNIDPRLVHIDPYATGYRRHQMRYLATEEPMDLAEARALWPHVNIEPETLVTVNRKSDKTSIYEGSTHGGHKVGQRERVIVKELWLNSTQTKSVPMKDEQGNYLRDEDGKIMKKSVRKYPYGRLVITANGKMLVNQGNPYDHGEFPFVFYPSRMAARLLSWGDAEPLITLADKMNRLLKDAMANLRVAMNSPWVIDRHAFDSAKKFNQLTQGPGLILPVQPGSRVERLQAGELPQSSFAFMEYLKNIFNDILGVQGVQRGQLEKGAQLSADAVSQLQAASAARTRLKSRLLETSLKFLGHLMQWNIRQFYDTDFKIAVSTPGSPDKQVLAWSGEFAKGEYSIDIQVGSSLPGSKEAGSALIMKMFEKGILPREWALRLLEFPGAEKIIEDIKQRENELVQMAGDEKGVLEVMQRRYKSTQGRKEAAPTL